MWSVSIGGCGVYQLEGVVCINWWAWSVSICGCGLLIGGGDLYQLVGVVCINWWVWSVLTGGCGLYQWVGVVCINWWVWSVSTVYRCYFVFRSLVDRIFSSCNKCTADSVFRKNTIV